MADIQIRQSVLAVVKEQNPGTPEPPSSGANAVAMRSDFAISPSFDTLTNDEIRASIGGTKPVLGSENPSVTLTHYLRASGTAGTAPNYDPVLESLFGSRDIAASERDTVNGSTVSEIKVDTGEGIEFRRGAALLIQDPVNGTRIRAVHGVTSDDLELGFNLPGAPASGVQLGRSITYSPVDTGHPTVSVWRYLGNGGKIDLVAGGRVTAADFNITAREFIDVGYTVDGIEYFVNPVEIDANSKYLDFTDDDGTHAVAISEDFYKTPYEFAAAVAAAANAATSETIEVTYSKSSGKYTVASSTSAVLSLLWDSGVNKANSVGAKLGFSVAADDSGSTSYVSDNAINLAFPFTPQYDSAQPVVAKNIEVMLGGAEDYVCFGASSVSISVANTATDKNSVCAPTGREGTAITSRAVTATITGYAKQYDVSLWDKAFNNESLRLQVSFGPKVGGNWVKGSSGCLYLASATATPPTVEDQDGIAAITVEVTGFVEGDGEGEFFLAMC